MPLLMLRDGIGMVEWEPTTALLCTACRIPFAPNREALETINFMFDMQRDDTLAKGEYFYLHKRCTNVEDQLDVFWGAHPMRWVLGIDQAMQRTVGSLAKHLRTRMPPGVYDRLYEDWAPALPSLKRVPAIKTQRQHQALILRETRKLASRFAILHRDQFRCRLCGIAASDGAHVRLEVDHIIPRSKGGKDTAENKWVLCFECNRGKGTRLL